MAACAKDAEVNFLKTHFFDHTSEVNVGNCFFFTGRPWPSLNPPTGGTSPIATGVQQRQPPRGAKLIFERNFPNKKLKTILLFRFESLVEGEGLLWRRRERFVPSFMEVWVYYEVYFKQEDSNGQK